VSLDLDPLDNVPNPIIYAVGAYFAGWAGGYVEGPSLPDWWPIGTVVLLCAVVVGYVLGSKLGDLWPDQYSNLLVATDADQGDGGAIWELNDAAMEELEIKKADRLFRWESPKCDVYEGRNLNVDQLVAVANWKGTKTGSELSKPVEREEVMRQIRNLRESHEEDARYGQAVRDAIPALLRQLDKRRAKNINAALEGHISPNLGDQSIDDMIRDQLPDEVIPEYLREGDRDGLDAQDDDQIGFQILDDSEALDPVENPQGPVRNDGGDHEI
jgi:hypothetical protein